VDVNDDVDAELWKSALEKLTEDEWSCVSMQEFKCGEAVGRREALNQVRWLITERASTAFLARTITSNYEEVCRC
jgi:hypothetical protein